MVKISADTCSPSSTTSSTSPRSRPASSSWNEADFDLRDSLDDTVATLALRAHKKGLELADHVAPDVPDALVGDPTGSGRSWSTWWATPSSSPSAARWCSGRGASRGPSGEVCLHFTVRDTGIGIPRTSSRSVFNAFSQADSSTTRKYGGTGLGLAISARLVEMMGGEIWLESEVGRGARSTSPSGSRRREDRSERPAPSGAVTVHGLRVLVVDDNATNRRILEEMLDQLGDEADAGRGRPQALAALERARGAGTPFALVLLDAMMPEMDGFTLAERIREAPSRWARP